MNKAMLGKSEWNMQVRLRPMPRRFDGGPTDPELPQLDRHWRVGNVQKEGVLLYHIGTPHFFLLGFDRIRSFISDTIRGENYGFLVLNAQVNLGGDHVWLEPLLNSQG
jgi:hypothetical protein